MNWTENISAKAAIRRSILQSAVSGPQARIPPPGKFVGKAIMFALIRGEGLQGTGVSGNRKQESIRNE